MGIHIQNVRRLLIRVGSRDNLEHEQVGNGIGGFGVLLDGLVEGGLGLLGAAQVQLADGLGHEAADGRGGGCLGELLKDVKRLLVFLTALLYVSMSSSSWYRYAIGLLRRGGQPRTRQG